ncbi:nSTAND1 domain-containing NTPase [Amycolatopsis sp. NPDC004747]
MPRPERPLGTGDEPQTLFARELRRVREAAGNPPYRRLAREAHYSVTTLSDAAGGRTFPTLPVTLAYVRACGGDPAEWERRWRETHALLSTPNGADDPQIRPPYLGLSAFRTADADRYFGRDALLETLGDRIGQHRLVAVLGASGSGKSSLLHAGLATADIRPMVAFTPGTSPLEECALHLAAFVGESAPALHREFTGDPTALHLRIRQALAADPAETELLLVVDQFEELFTLCADPAERQAFITALTHAATAPRARARVVLGVRSDFFAHCTRYPELRPALGAGQVLIGPMSPDELREAIVKPAAAAHYTVENALVTRLVAEATSRPGALPLVSHALLETWRRRSGMTLTVAGYEQTGGIRDALARTAENVYAGFDERRQLMVRQILLRLTALGEGTEDTKRRLTRAELDDTPAVRTVLAALTAARLVTVDHDIVEITHETLIEHWPRLRTWLAIDREGQRVHRRLAEDAAVWESLRRDPDTLYRGVRLARTRELADSVLTARERAFVHAGRAAETARQAASLRRSRLLRALVIVLVVLVGVTTAATVAALRANETVTAQRDTVLAQQVAEEAVTLRASRPALAAQLALAAYRLRPTQRNRDALISAVAIPLNHVQEVDATAFSPDGRLIASASADHLVRLWNVADPAHPKPSAVLAGHGDAVRAVSFDPGGTVLATAGRDRTVRLWELGDGTQPAQLAVLTGHQDTIYSLAYAPDARTLATASYDHTVRLWDVRVPARPVALPVLTAHARNVKAVAFSPDSRLLASGSDDRTVRLWDVGEPTRPAERLVLTGHSDLVVTVAFSRDGRSIASGGDDRTVRLWNTADPVRPEVLSGHTDVVSSVAFSPDRRLLASASYDHSVRLWDMSDRGHALLATLTGHTGAVEAVTFSPDGRHLATASDDHTVLLWETDPDRAATRACELAHPAITREEWASHLPGLSYEPPCRPG